MQMKKKTMKIFMKFINNNKTNYNQNNIIMIQSIKILNLENQHFYKEKIHLNYNHNKY